MANAPRYPFRPRSNRHLQAGQFWAVPLGDQRYGCGRVMVPKSIAGPRVMFIAGLMDWIGDAPPNERSIAGRQILEQGSAHVRTITETGGEILGFRPLATDRLAARVEDDDLSTWGSSYIVELARRRLDEPR